jgi:lysozyme
MIKIIDVSCWNVVTDWAAVKASGVGGVIIRAGFGRVLSQKDKSFEAHYAGAKAAGLLVGAYWYSYAMSAAEAGMEAAVFAQAIDGKCFELPVYFDIEESRQLALGLRVCSDMADKFCSYMEGKGYYAGIYSYDAFFGSFSDTLLKRYTTWVARVESVKPTRCTTYDMWQYTWKAKINGMPSACDCSYCYKDFATIIRNAGLNGYSKHTTYSVTARAAGLSKAQANDLGDLCKKNGMTVVIAED